MFARGILKLLVGAVTLAGLTNAVMAQTTAADRGSSRIWGSPGTTSRGAQPARGTSSPFSSTAGSVNNPFAAAAADAREGAVRPTAQSTGSLGATASLLDRVDPSAVERIEATVPQAAVPIVLEPVESKLAPRTDYDGKFSLQFCTAAMLVTGRVDVRTFAEETLRDETILDLAHKVGYQVRDYETWPAAFPGGTCRSVLCPTTLPCTSSTNRSRSLSVPASSASR